MKRCLLLVLAAFQVYFLYAMPAGRMEGDSLVVRQETLDSLDIAKNIVQIRRIKFEILRQLRDDRYKSPALRASIDSGIVLLANLTDSIQKSGNKVAVLDCKKYLSHLLTDLNSGDIPSAKTALALQGYLSVKRLSDNQESILPAILQLDPSYSHPILTSISNPQTPGWKESTDYLVCQTFVYHPSSFLKIAFEFPDADCIDSLLPSAAKRFPEDLYIFSQASTSGLGKKIMKSDDELVRLIVSIAATRQGRVYYPFLDDLYHKKITVAQINKVLGAGNQVAYYKLLVKTLTGYNERVTRLDTPIAMNVLVEKIAYNADMDFVRVINSLHGSPDAVRLKVLSTLSPEELYYLCINGEKDLYTSSYLKIYNSIFARQRQLNAYQLLEKLHFDHFRRFIKMAGTYNTLDDFLSRMTKDEAGKLMYSFIDGLNTTASLEDVIDVANSYASIRNDSLRRFILQEVANKMQSETQAGAGSPKIYSLLNTLFLSLDPSNHINLSQALGITDVYQLTQQSLTDSTGRIIIQQFFYGDADGKTAFNTFLQWLKKNNWQITTTKYWIEANSRKGTPVRIFANLPLNDNTGRAEFAQTVLRTYLRNSNQLPSIAIHRGHSYFANNTISQLSPNNKLIIMGSCGSFSQISSIHTYSPQAQVISSRQEGTVTINQPMISYIVDLLSSGQDLNWPVIWAKLTTQFKKNTRFDDYVPPYQNLGSVLLMTGVR